MVQGQQVRGRIGGWVVNYTGRCVGGPKHGDYITCEYPEFRAAVFQLDTFEATGAIAPDQPVTFQTVTYSWHGTSGGMGVWLLPEDAEHSAEDVMYENRKCLSVEPGVKDFPARCRKPLNHTDPKHEGFAQYGETGTEWEDVGDE